MNGKVSKKIRHYYREAAKEQGINDMEEWLAIQKRKVTFWRIVSYGFFCAFIITLAWGILR